MALNCKRCLQGKSPSRSNLSVALRSGRQFLDLLVRDCMPELDKVFKQQYEDIDKFLKSVQNATKIISYACAHIQVGSERIKISRPTSSSLYRILESKGEGFVPDSLHSSIQEES